MENFVIIRTGPSNCHDFREDCMAAINKHHGTVDFDKVWHPIGEEFVLSFIDEAHASYFVLSFTAEMGCTFRLTKEDYRESDWADAYPGIFIEVISP